MTIYLDMDGTFADLYSVPNWLDYLIAEDTFPYENAKPMMRFCELARMLNKVQKKGYKIGIISWLSKCGSPSYERAVTAVKKDYLAKHLPSVKWDEIHIVKYGTPKSTCGCGILFDDEKPNRDEWNRNGGTAYRPEEIFKILRDLC